MRRNYQRAADYAGRAFFIEQRDQRFAHSELEDRRFDIDRRILPECRRRRFDRLLVARCESTQSVLNTIAQLAQHDIRNIQRVLADEKDSDSLRTNQTHHLFDLLHQRFGRLVEQQMGFVEEEDHLWFFWISDFRQVLEQLRKHPQQKGRVKLGRLHELVRRKYINDAASVAVGLYQVHDVQRRLSEKDLSALLLDFEQAALDCANACG